MSSPTYDGSVVGLVLLLLALLSDGRLWLGLGDDDVLLQLVRVHVESTHPFEAHA